MFSSSEVHQHVLLRDVIVAADWCCQTQFKGALKLPAVLFMNEEEKKELHSWEDGHDESSLAELLTFAFKKERLKISTGR